MIERNLADRSLYRLTLVKAGTETHKEILTASGGKRWGIADIHDPPVSEPEITEAEQQQQAHENKPLELFDNNAALVETRSRRIARSRAFQLLTTKYYDGKCAVCRFGFRTKGGRSEVEAAHIVPRSNKGADDARNGLSLCRSHHWAFDWGLWGIGEDGKIVVPHTVLKILMNAELKSFLGKTLLKPSDSLKNPDPKALAWHLKNIVGM